MVTQQGVGDDPFATAEILARMARLDGRPLHTELLTVDATIERIDIKRIVREDRQSGNAIADPVVGGLERRLAQVLLVGRLQHMIGNIAGTGHDPVTVVHRLGDDDRHQTVRVGDLLCIAGLQRCQCRQERALLVHKAEYVGHVAERQLFVEVALLARQHHWLALGRRQVRFWVPLS
jgi:hypothetical protein